MTPRRTIVDTGLIDPELTVRNVAQALLELSKDGETPLWGRREVRCTLLHLTRLVEEQATERLQGIGLAETARPRD